MKILRLDTYFLLPDDFEGDVNDAIQALIDYRKEKKLSKFQKNEEPAKAWEDMSPIEKWNCFCQATQQGFKHVGSASCSEFIDGWNEI